MSSIEPPQSNFNEALAYVLEVKQRFATEPEVFSQFLSFVKAADGRDPAQGFAQLKEELESLFQGHPDLIEGIDTFRPRIGPSSSL